MTAGARLFLGLIGTPYESDLLTTTIRLAAAAAGQGHLVTVWACGYATALTMASVGALKPRDVRDWDARHPSTAALVARLLASADGQIEWLACRYCCDERGTGGQMAGVRVRPPYEFAERAGAADACLVLGVK